MAARATGETEITERLFEAAAQVVTRGLNTMPPRMHDEVIEALARGATMRLILDLGDPVELRWLLVKKRGGETQLLPIVG